MTTHTRLLSVVALLTFTGAACGGSSSGKLSSRVDGAHLAPVSTSQRAGEADAQREFFLAEWQLAFTESQLKSAKLDINIAKNDLASAKLEVKNAKLELKAAEESGDQNAIATKTHGLKVATLKVEVGKVAIERAKQSKVFLEKRLAHEKRALRSQESAVELARAKGLESAGIQPPNFDAKRYKSQHTERVSSAKETKASVDSESAKLAALDKKLQGARNAVVAAEGGQVAQEAPPQVKPMEPLADSGSPEPATTDSPTTDEPKTEPKPEEPSPATDGETPTEGSESTSDPDDEDATTKPNSEVK